MFRISSLIRSCKGSVMAEAALIIPMLVGVTFFIIEFGNVLYLANSLNQISRTAARYASVTPTYTQQDLINVSGAMTLLPDVSKLTLTINPAPGAAKTVGATLTVTVQYAYTPIINPFGLLMSGQAWAPTIMSASVSRAEVSSAS